MGADLPEAESDRHRRRRRDVARRDRLPRVRIAGGRRHRPRDVANPQRPDDPRRRFGRSRHDPRRMSGYTRTLSALRRADEPAFGGKSAGLGELLAAGLRVPAGFALACSAYRLARRHPPMPELVREEIALRYAELGETVGVPSPPVAVRSSAVGEDSAEATFAGQQESVLWVRGSDAVCDAVRTCWASLHSATAV